MLVQCADRVTDRICIQPVEGRVRPGYHAVKLILRHLPGLAGSDALFLDSASGSLDMIFH